MSKLEGSEVPPPPQEVSSFDAVPDEVIVHILTFLPATQLVQVEMVSKRMRAAAMKAAENIRFLHFYEIERKDGSVSEKESNPDEFVECRCTENHFGDQRILKVHRIRLTGMASVKDLR